MKHCDAILKKIDFQGKIIPKVISDQLRRGIFLSRFLWYISLFFQLLRPNNLWIWDRLTTMNSVKGLSTFLKATCFFDVFQSILACWLLWSSLDRKVIEILWEALLMITWRYVEKLVIWQYLLSWIFLISWCFQIPIQDTFDFYYDCQSHRDFWGWSSNHQIHR